jgi:hypothetical protein
MRTIYLSKGRKARVLVLQNAMDNHLGVPLSIQGIKRHWSAILTALAYEAAHFNRETP